MIREREKRGLLSHLSAHGKIQTVLRTNHIIGCIIVPSEKKKNNYHLTKSENSLQNSDNLMQLKSVLDILPWHRNRHLIEYHIKCDSQYKLWIVLENFQATNFNQNLNALWLSCLHLVHKQFFPFQGRLSSGKNIIIAISCGVLSSLFSGSIQARMYWLFRNLRFLFLASTMEFVTANTKYVN